MKYSINFYQGSNKVFSQEVVTDSISKLTQYVRSTKAFLKTKHRTIYINYKIEQILI